MPSTNPHHRTTDPRTSAQFEDMLFRSRQYCYGSEPPCIEFADANGKAISSSEMRTRMKARVVDY